MSVNLSAAICPKTTKSFGPLFHTIDYFHDTQMFTIGNKEVRMNQEDLEHLYQKASEAKLKETKLQLGKFIFELTKKELERIQETCENAKRIGFMRYRLNVRKK